MDFEGAPPTYLHHPCLRTAVITLLFAVALGPAHAARTAVTHYTTREGLPQAQVNALAQDREGYLWAGTLAGGVARYNGHQWDVFDASSGLPGGSIYALALDPHGTLYAATSGGAAWFEGGRWVAVPAPPEPLQASTNALLPLGRELWLGSPSGLLVWTPPGRPTLAFPSDPLATSEVLALAADGTDGLWVGTTRGLARVRTGPARRIEAVPGLPAGRVIALLSRPQRPLLASVSRQGLFEGTPGAFQRVGDDKAPGRRVFALLAESEDPDAVWIGTDEFGAFRRHGAQLERFAQGEGLADPHVYTILEDREGILWFGTDAGLTKRRPSAFLTYGEADGFPPGAAIYAMAEDGLGSLWLSAWDHGAIRLGHDGSLRRFTQRDGLPDARVFDVAVAPGGTVWLLTGRGLARVEGDRVRVPPLAKEMPRDVWVFLARPDGALVLGGREGLAVLRGDAVEKVAELQGLGVMALSLAADGTIWCGGEAWGAAAVRDGRVVERLTVADGLPSNQVTGVLQDSRRTLWVTTDRGAWSRQSDGSVRTLDRGSGLPDSYVYWVGEDREGALWFGTNRGVARLAPAEPIEVFTSRDGLGADECNDDGFLVDSHGHVYVATIGVSRYLGPPRPRRPVDPPVRIEALLVDGRPRPIGSEVDLPPTPGPLTFRFAALSFMDEHTVMFSYRLVGLSDVWNGTVAGQRETTYGGLPAGKYTFEVVARTADGRGSSVPARLVVRIQPHWWQTRTAGLLGALVLAVALLAYVKVRERRLVAARDRLEREVAARTEELRRANERLAELAVTDELTGMANRRKVLEELEGAMALARRQKTSLSVALADMDHFKEVNDTLGHGAGDQMLVAAAQAMRGVLRNVDLIGRYGGEEFIVLLPGSDLAGAREAGERLRRAIETLEFRNPVTGRHSTISIGLATLEAEAIDPVELIRRADQALYEAKATGRNCVVSHRTST